MPNFEEQYARAMLDLCRKEGHVPVIRTRAKSGASVIPVNRDIRADILRILGKGPNTYHAVCAGIDAPKGAVRQCLSGMKKSGEIRADYPSLKNHGAIWSLNTAPTAASAPAVPEHEKGIVQSNHPENGSEPRQQAPSAFPAGGAHQEAAE